MTPRSRAPWLATVLIAAAAFLGFAALGVMIELGGWLRTPFFILLLTTAAVVITRLLSRQRTLPPLVGVMTALLAMVPVFAVSDEGQQHILPTPSALLDLGRAIRGGVEYAASAVAPAQEDPHFTALLTLGLVLLFVLTDYLAVSWRAGATSGLLLLAPWMPAVIFQHRVSTVALIASIMLWLGVLVLTRRLTTAERSPAYGSGFVAIAATLIAVVLVTPTALGGLGWGMFPRIGTPGDANTTTRLNLALDLRTSLTTNSRSPVLVYDTTGSRPSALKLYTLTDFDGVQWAREDTTVPTTPAAGEVLWPTPIEGWTQRERTRLEMQVLDLQETNLPLPPTPRMVDIDGPWYYDAELDEVVGRDVTARDARYAIETDSKIPTRDSLEALPAGPSPLEADMDPRYLEVAPSIDTNRVGDLARELTAHATTRHGQAVALQNYLRNSREFTYDTSVSPTGSDAISTFLDDREGYCVQFATTMVVMARTLDIPSRMALGFLSGTPTDHDSYVVRGGDAHVWPELWFPEQGWVRFEPTPAIQTGAPPNYADPLVVQPGEIPEPAPEVPEPAPMQPEEPEAPEPAAEDTPVSRAPSEPTVPLWVWVAAGLVIVMAALGVWWWRAYLSARAMRERGPEYEWESLRTRLPEHLRWPVQLTPHEAAEHVNGKLRETQLAPSQQHEDQGESGSAESTTSTGTHTDHEVTIHQAVAAMTALAAVVEAHRYSPKGSHTQAEELHKWAKQVVAGATSRKRAEA